MLLFWRRWEACDSFGHWPHPKAMSLALTLHSRGQARLPDEESACHEHNARSRVLTPCWNHAKIQLLSIFTTIEVLCPTRRGFLQAVVPSASRSPSPKSALAAPLQGSAKAKNLNLQGCLGRTYRAFRMLTARPAMTETSSSKIDPLASMASRPRAAHRKCRPPAVDSQMCCSSSLLLETTRTFSETK